MSLSVKVSPSLKGKDSTLQEKMNSLSLAMANTLLENTNSSGPVIKEESIWKSSHDINSSSNSISANSNLEVYDPNLLQGSRLTKWAPTVHETHEPHHHRLNRAAVIPSNSPYTNNENRVYEVQSNQPPVLLMAVPYPVETNYNFYPVSPNNISFKRKSNRPPLSSLLGHVRRLSRDQVGCRLLQQSLDEDGPEAATAILREGLFFLGDLMTDPFGNYLFQKILEKISEEELLLLVESVSPRLVNAALNLHGTRSVQKVVEMSVTKMEAQMVVTRSLSSSAARLCIDSHGNHVIQRILQKFPPQYSNFIFDAVANSVGDVARHRHGCCVIQRCLDSPSSPSRSNLIKRIVEKALDLMQDAFGNYVVQYVLDVCSDEEASPICESVVGRVGLLAIQKFSSNVMEKCLERSSEWVKELYLREISSQNKIRDLMQDPFGNYVVQRAILVATHVQAVRLVEAMRPHLQGMRNTAGGRRILAKICRRFPDFNSNEIIVFQYKQQQHNLY